MTKPLDVAALREYLQDLRKDNYEQWKESQAIAGANCPGANQPLGAMAAIDEILEFLDGY